MTLSADNMPETSIREEVDRILASEGFSHSPRMTAFLGYVVNETLAGRGGYLKEYRIALDVFGREADFDPQTNPIVRVQASKLRRTLKLYYAEKGQNDPIQIELPKGGYVPQWTLSAPAAGSGPGTGVQAGIAAEQPAPGPQESDLPESESSRLEHRAEPEQRQLTVLQCELADAERLMATLDAEDAFELTHGYQKTCTQAVERYGGHVAHYMGGELRVFFGYPTAFEDSAERAIRAALAITEQVAQLSSPKQASLHVRIGIATGRVVVGDMGGPSVTERDAVVGDTPNLAVHLQQLAEPGSIVIGPRTRRLIKGRFSFEDIGGQSFPGFSESMHAWKVLGLQQPTSRFDAAHGADLVPIIGRDQEIALIEERWILAQQGEGQAVVLFGEPGIGKSRILRALQDKLSDEDHIALRYQYSPHHTNSAFYPELMETDPELTAHHLTQAGHNRRAIEQWEKAGRRAIARSANPEAIQHLTQALQLLQILPDDGKRLQHELKLLISLGGARMAANGYAAPEVEDTYQRAEKLCHQLGDPPEFMWALHGIFMFRFIRGELQKGRQIAQKIQRVAKHSGYEMQNVCAQVLLGDVDFFTGTHLEQSRAHYEQAISLYDREKHGSCKELFGDDPAVIAMSLLATTHWLLGYPDTGAATMERTIKEARDTDHPHSLAMATLHKSWHHTVRHEPQEARTWAEKSIELASEQGFPDILGWSTATHGWALCQLGEYEQGIAEQSQGIAIFQGTGARLALTLFLSTLAESFGSAGDPEEGLRNIERALTVAKTGGEYFWEPELYRIKGNLLLAAENSKGDVEACYQQAVDSAVTRQMKLFELRAVMDLARLWKRQRKKEKARKRLEQIYGWFTEGFNSPDLKEAKAVLEVLH